MLKTIKEYIPITATSGIFSSFKNPIWSVVLPDSDELDKYFNLRYGDRIASKKLEYWSDSEGHITGDNLKALSTMIYDVNANRWKHLFNAYMVEYNPIENTDYIETLHETNDGTKTVDSETGNTETRNLANGNTHVIDSENSNTETRNLANGNTQTTVKSTTTSGTAATDSSGSSSGSDSNANNVYGFNSVIAVGHDASSGSNSSTTSAESDTTTSSTGSENATVTDSGTNTGTLSNAGTEDTTVTDSGTETGTVSNAGTEDTTVNDSNVHEYELRKHGNIGVTTNVTMLREDIDFWWKWSFVDYICQDICDFIALSIY